MKKIISLLLTLLLCFMCTSCGTNNKETESTTKSYTIGICQFVQHEALDAATKGFKDAIEKALPGQVTFLEKNASGDSANCPTIINNFVSSKVDLIMANATPALTAAVSATNTIPILGTSVTAYGVALDITDFNGTVGGNVSGTSDLADLDEQANMIKEWFPDVKNVGLLFCSAEANSRYQIDEIKSRLEKMGYVCTEYAFTDSNDVSSVTEAASDKSELIYIPTDNTAASNKETIANVIIPKRIPIICGEEGLCKDLGVCTLSISYYDLGYTTGEMAVKILTGQEKISEMPISYATASKKYDYDICFNYGIVPVDGYEVINK